jgi:hypothetical protein
VFFEIILEAIFQMAILLVFVLISDFEDVKASFISLTLSNAFGKVKINRNVAEAMSNDENTKTFK